MKFDERVKTLVKDIVMAFYIAKDASHIHQQIDSFSHVVNELLNFLGKVSLFCELLGKLLGLLRCGDLAGEQEPEHGLGNHLLAARCRRKDLLAFRNRETVEADTLI